MENQIEAKKERTLEDVQREYNSLCAKAGHLQYTLVTVGADLKLVNEQLRELNLEAAKIQSKTE